MEQRDSEPRADPQPARSRWRTDRILVLLGIGVVLWLLGDVLLLVFAGILFGVALDGFAHLLARRTRVKRGWALLIVVILMVITGVVAAATVLAPLVSQIRQVWAEVPALADRALAAFRDYVGIEPNASEPVNGQSGIELVRSLVPASAAALGVAISVVVVIAIGLFLAINPDLYKRGVAHLVPAPRRERVAEVISASGRGLRWWLVGQACSMAILGTVTSLMLWLLDVPLWLGLGLLTAVLTFVPYFGPLIAAVPVLLMSFSQGLETGLTVLVLYAVLQNIEGFFLTPAIQQRAVHIPPALLISTQVAMSALFGLPGLLLAAPLTPCLIVIVKQLYIEDVLGEQL